MLFTLNETRIELWDQTIKYVNSMQKELQKKIDFERICSGVNVAFRLSSNNNP